MYLDSFFAPLWILLHDFFSDFLFIIVFFSASMRDILDRSIDLLFDSLLIPGSTDSSPSSSSTPKASYRNYVEDGSSMMFGSLLALIFIFFLGHSQPFPGSDQIYVWPHFLSQEKKCILNHDRGNRSDLEGCLVIHKAVHPLDAPLPMKCPTKQPHAHSL